MPIPSLSREYEREMEFREEQEAFPNEIWERGELILDSVRPREPSPCGIAFGDSILPVPNGQDSTASRVAGLAQDDRI